MGRLFVAGRIYANTPDEAHELIISSIAHKGLFLVGTIKLRAVSVQTMKKIWYEWRAEVI